MQFLEILSVWEIAYRWHGIDPDDTESGKIPSNVKETLRELMLALNLYLNLYDAHNEQIFVEQFGLTRVRKTKFARQLEKYLHEGTFERDFLRSVFIRRDELPKWCRGRDIALPGFWFPELGPGPTTEPQPTVPAEAEHAISAGEPAAQEVKPAATAKARKAALKRHEPTQKIKEELFKFYDGGQFPSQAEAIRRFMKSRTQEGLKPLVPSNAERTLRGALSKYLRPKRSR